MKVYDGMGIVGTGNLWEVGGGRWKMEALEALESSGILGIFGWLVS